MEICYKCNNEIKGEEYNFGEHKICNLCAGYDCYGNKEVNPKDTTTYNAMGDIENM